MGTTGDALSLQWIESSNGGTSWTNIAGATASTYQLKATDAGDWIEVVATATNLNNAMASQTRAPTAAVTANGPFAYSWLGSSGDWNQSGNWSPTGIPTSSDSATISAGGTAYTVTVDTADTASSLTLSSASATLNDASSLTLGALNLSAGALAIGSGGSLVLSGAASLTGGQLQVNGGGAVSGGSIANTAGGMIALAGGAIGLTSSATSLSNASGATISGYGSILGGFSNAGTVTASGGTLTLSGAVTGAGALKIATNSILELGGAEAGLTVTMGAAFSKLQLDAPSSYSLTNTISGLSSDEAVVLKGVTATSAVKNASGQLVVSNDATAVETLQLASPATGLLISAVGSGGIRRFTP